MIKWTDIEVDYLKDNYENTRNEDLSIYLGKSINSISNKANYFNLKKTKLHKSKMIGQRNKMVGRDLSYDKLFEIALGYKTKSQFYMMDPSAYSAANRNKIMYEICKHMIKQSYSIPQLILNYILIKILPYEIIKYNDRSAIKPYELDIFIPNIGLAFEYDGLGWHNDDKVDKFKICQEIGINLITIRENNRKYEIDIKEQIVKNLLLINKLSNSKIQKEDVFNIFIDMNLVLKGVIDIDYIKNICKNYSNYSLFRKENINLYNKLFRLNILNEYTSHMKKRGGITYDLASVEVKKYEYFSDFLKNSYRFYVWIKKNKKETLLVNLKMKQNKKLKFSK